MNDNNLIDEIQNWYAGQCDGDWEKSVGGFKITTLSNPGWSLAAPLDGTELEHKRFDEYERNYGDDVDWVRCWRDETKFHGVGGAKNLAEILKIFVFWVKSETL